MDTSVSHAVNTYQEYSHHLIIITNAPNQERPAVDPQADRKPRQNQEQNGHGDDLRAPVRHEVYGVDKSKIAIERVRPGDKCGIAVNVMEMRRLRTRGTLWNE